MEPLDVGATADESKQSASAARRDPERMAELLSRKFSQPLRPLVRVELKRGRRGEVHLWIFARKIVRAVDRPGPQLFIPLDSEEALRNPAIGAVSGKPHGLTDCGRVIVERNWHCSGEPGPVRAHASVIVELRAAYANGHIEHALVRMILNVQ